MTHLVHFLGILFFGCLHPAISERCTRIADRPSCVCQTSGGVIDLTPLSLQNQSKAWFMNVVDPQGAVYSYNPCYPITIGLCKDSYMCQKVDQSGEQHGIADSGSEFINGTSNGNFYATYKSKGNLFIDEIEVQLVCQQNVGEDKSYLVAKGLIEFILKFELHSCLSCPGGCKETATELVGIAGLILIIMFILAFIIYFIVGAVIMKVQRGATGSDIIPNKSFWVDLPFLVKDGCVFVTIPCRVLIATRRYSAI